MNIICIVNDSLRADHCSCYDGVGGIRAVEYGTAEGIKKTATPHLDASRRKAFSFRTATPRACPRYRLAPHGGRDASAFRSALGSLFRNRIIYLPKSFGATDTPVPWSLMCTMGINRCTI